MGDDIVGAHYHYIELPTYITRRVLDTLPTYVACVSLGQDGGGNE